MKKCPFCAEEIKEEAIICRYCNKSFVLIKEPKKGSFVWEVIFAILSIIFIIIPYMRIWPKDPLEGFYLEFYLPSNQMLLIGLIGIVLSIIMSIGLFTKFGVPGWVWIIYGIILIINPLRIIVEFPSFLKYHGMALILIISLIYFFGGLIKLAVVKQKNSKAIALS